MKSIALPCSVPCVFTREPAYLSLVIAFGVNSWSTYDMAIGSIIVSPDSNKAQTKTSEYTTVVQSLHFDHL